MFKSREIVAVVPARSGSKRLPNKNIMKIGGKTLIQRAIDCGLNSKYVDKVILSSDSDDYLSVADPNTRLIKHRRPEALATDESSSISCVLDLQSIVQPDAIIILLQPTSPLRSSADIDGGLELTAGYNWNVTSVCETSYPLSWCGYLDSDKSISTFAIVRKTEDDQLYSRKSFRLNGAFYIREFNELLLSRRFLTEETLGYVMSLERSIDIDTLLDYKLAELIEKNSG